MRFLLTGLLTALCLHLCTTAYAAPRHVYLTWADTDTSRTMQVNFQSMKGAKEGRVFYSKSPDGINKNSKGHATLGTTIPGLVDGRTIHHANLTGLKPGTTYYFCVSTPEDGLSETYSFRTIAKKPKQVRFITGGDMGVEHNVQTLLDQAGQHSPDFAFIGGDIAYGNGELNSVVLWDTWLDNWAKYMEDGDNRLIPIVAAIGNHETNDILNDPSATAPFFIEYFNQAGTDTHFVRTFGKEVAILALDTGHVETHESQVPWLTETLAAHKKYDYTYAVYHIPLYPSVRDYDGKWSKLGRDQWAPVFDAYGLTAAFENHDHALKVTKKIKGNKVGDEGTLYLGDGCFGRPPRDIPSDRKWYESIAKSQSHFWLVEVEKRKVTYKALDETGALQATVKVD